MDPETLLLTEEDVRQSLPQVLYVRPGPPGGQYPAGDVLRAAAAASAYRRLDVVVGVGGEERPVTVSALALIFPSAARAEHTFRQVAEAAHLRTDVEGVRVAVETVTAANGLVSYWAFITQGPVILVLTVDTLNPQEISMSEFRQLVLRAGETLKSALPPES
ncbi:MAG TPA: hypothetical protein VFB58_12340 [Chloroflexota bacterium]|nr:hypothetical protein [Chloroflexota bacterium]